MNLFGSKNRNRKIGPKFGDKNTKGLNIKGECIIESKKKYFRPTEVDNLLGNQKKAKKELGWKPKISFYQLVKEMIDEDMKLIKQNVKKKR